MIAMHAFAVPICGWGALQVPIRQIDLGLIRAASSGTRTEVRLSLPRSRRVLSVAMSNEAITPVPSDLEPVVSYGRAKTGPQSGTVDTGKFRYPIALTDLVRHRVNLFNMASIAELTINSTFEPDFLRNWKPDRIGKDRPARLARDQRQP